jgi:hypothetical protein
MLRRIIGGIYQGPERLFLLYASFARLGNFESDKSEQEIIAAPLPRVPTAGRPAIMPEEEVQWLFRPTSIPEPGSRRSAVAFSAAMKEGSPAGARGTYGPAAGYPFVRSCGHD